MGLALLTPSNTALSSLPESKPLKVRYWSGAKVGGSTTHCFNLLAASKGFSAAIIALTTATPVRTLWFGFLGDTDLNITWLMLLALSPPIATAGTSRSQFPVPFKVWIYSRSLRKPAAPRGGL